MEDFYRIAAYIMDKINLRGLDYIMIEAKIQKT